MRLATFVVRRRVAWSDIEGVSISSFSPVVNMIDAECVVLHRAGCLRGQRATLSYSVEGRPAAFQRAVDQLAAARGVATTASQRPSASGRAARAVLAAGVATLFARRSSAGRR